jgi:hypothetical protein
MSPESFNNWLATMKDKGFAKSDADCARQLGKSDDTIVTYKRKGTDLTVALACRALLHRMEPYA